MNLECDMLYQRCNDGQSFENNGVSFNNIFVVYYTPSLIYKFNDPNSIKVFSWLQTIKYIQNYIYKGRDKTTMTLGKILWLCEAICWRSLNWGFWDYEMPFSLTKWYLYSICIYFACIVLIITSFVIRKPKI